MKVWGNVAILENFKSAFLCSQRCPADVVLKSYDWAKQQRKVGNCILCGNHSQIGKYVFEILLKGTQPLVLVLARGLKGRWELGIEQAVQNNRLLVISPFGDNIRRVTRETAKLRNEKILEISDRIVVGFKTEGGQLDGLLQKKEYEVI